MKLIKKMRSPAVIGALVFFFSAIVFVIIAIGNRDSTLLLVSIGAMVFGFGWFIIFFHAFENVRIIRRIKKIKKNKEEARIKKTKTP